MSVINFSFQETNNPWHRIDLEDRVNVLHDQDDSGIRHYTNCIAKRVLKALGIAIEIKNSDGRSVYLNKKSLKKYMKRQNVGGTIDLKNLDDVVGKLNSIEKSIEKRQQQKRAFVKKNTSPAFSQTQDTSIVKPFVVSSRRHEVEPYDANNAKYFT